MDTPHTWWTPLVQQLATGIGSSILSGVGVLFAAGSRRSSSEKKLDELCLDITNIQGVQADQAAHLVAIDKTIERYAEDRGLLRDFNRDIGRLEGQAGVKGANR